MMHDLDNSVEREREREKRRGEEKDRIGIN
jgi:hypothetical protein